MVSTDYQKKYVATTPLNRFSLLLDLFDLKLPNDHIDRICISDIQYLFLFRSFHSFMSTFDMELQPLLARNKIITNKINKRILIQNKIELSIGRK